MEKSWFSKRLTDAKQKSVLYLSLAEIIQSLTSSFVEPCLQRITNRKSIFSMGEEDLAIRTNELGQFFTIRTENSSSIPMLLQQRFDEIHFKGTDRPINQTIYREFDGLHVAWEPLYAPVDIEKYPYGTVLITQSTLESTGGIYGEMFLTSRGMISVSINELTENMGSGGGAGSERADQSEITEAVLTKFNQFVRPLLPLHIVFDGLSLFISVYADELPETFTLFSVSDTNKAYVWTEIADDVISFDSIIRLPAITATPCDIADFTSLTFDREKADGAILDFTEKGLFDDRIDVWSQGIEGADLLVLGGVSVERGIIFISEQSDLLNGTQFIQHRVTPPSGDLTPGWDDKTVLFDDTKLDMQLLDRKDS
ncbi:hypothetical protein [Citrobacter cronae]|uniref:hypothetical protein n=1 Tax=Citrobacter cronae TaxID=1748967 RepID=UPI0018681E12|nr:hypothetical protein [Citrobacter cronae]